VGIVSMTSSSKGASTNSLTSMYPHSTQIVVGTLIAHINDTAIIGYAVLLFPVLKRFSEALALGYVAFKLVEATMLVGGAATLLSLIALSQKYLAAGAIDAPYFQASAEVTLAQQFWASRLAAISYLVATPILNFLLYRSLLVPRFISVWGFIGASIVLIQPAGIGPNESKCHSGAEDNHDAGDEPDVPEACDDANDRRYQSERADHDQVGRK
jgi:Domain of unknown function (DUF4386)